MKRHHLFLLAALLLPGILVAAQDRDSKGNSGGGERWSVVSKGVLLDEFTGVEMDAARQPQ